MSSWDESEETNPKAKLGRRGAAYFVENLDILRRVVSWTDYVDEGSFNQAVFIADHADFFDRLVDSARNVQLEEFPYYNERLAAIEYAREGDYV